MQLTRNVYYFDYSKETYNYLMTSRILRQSEKDLLKGIVEEKKKVDELAKQFNCSTQTICRARKKLYYKLECLIYYNGSIENIEEYYKQNYKQKRKKRKTKVETTYKVYLLTFPNNKVYIGMTSVEEKDRWKDGNGYIYNETMYNDILKYGWKNVKKNILYKYLSYNEAREKEKEMIIHYKSHLKKYGYNRSF